MSANRERATETSRMAIFQSERKANGRTESHHTKAAHAEMRAVTPDTRYRAIIMLPIAWVRMIEESER